ncbi:HAD family acid phosphatase [Metamycoplasma buccale]|uniref:HAD family acid phosphatase n=1 Tax=Metamycoplasma buccale TaxID=55602 RepID=UPI00398EB6B4
MKSWKKLLSLGAITLAAISPSVMVSCNSDSKIKNELDKTKKELESKNKEIQKLKEERKTLGLLYANAWNTFTADKDNVTLGQYKAAKHAFDKMISQTSISPNTDKDGKVQNPTNGKYIPAVFMDIDDTILNNFAYQNYLITNNLTYNPESWDKFVKSEASTEVRGAIDFIKYVWSKGGVVMFNSNRNQSNQIQATKNNLKKIGLDEKYMPDWVWWMKGSDATKDKPWKETKGKSSKEERMHAFDTKTFDLSEYGSGNAVKFRTIMKIGDDINDFHDNATKGKSTAEQKEAAKKFEHLMGNMDINQKGVYFDKKEWKTLDYATSYVQIGGQASYGGWVHSLFKAHNVDTDALLELLRKHSWKPTE